MARWKWYAEPADTQLDEEPPPTWATEHTNELPAADLPHTPRRPEWTCAADDKPWPCEYARAELGAEFGEDRVALAVYMAGQLHRAAGELTDPDSELYRRFIAWTRP